MEILFWSSLFLILYTYFLYGAFIWIYLKLFPKQDANNIPAPTKPLTVAILVACYNEEEFIKQKIENLLALNYPNELLSLVFVTDGSTDKTVSTIKEYLSDSNNKISHYHHNERKGKQHAVNRVMPLLHQDIIVFNDCNTLINAAAIDHIIPHFYDEKVGVVNGEKKIIVNTEDDALSSGEGLYWKYESTLKKLDSDFYSSVGSAGELFAIRRLLYQAVPQNISIEDFYLSMAIVLDGYRNVYEPKAFAKEYASYALTDEFKRKRRISSGAFQTIFTLTEIYKLKHLKILFLYISHRVFRWTLAPLALITLLISNVYLNGSFYSFFLIAQLAFYFLAIVGLFARTIKLKHTFIFVPFYFVFMNVALLIGFYDFLRNKNNVVWEKVRRKKV